MFTADTKVLHFLPLLGSLKVCELNSYTAFTLAKLIMSAWRHTEWFASVSANDAMLYCTGWHAFQNCSDMAQDGTAP